MTKDSHIIRLKDETIDRIAKHGKFQDTFDSVINRILDGYEGKPSEY